MPPDAQDIPRHIHDGVPPDETAADAARPRSRMMRILTRSRGLLMTLSIIVVFTLVTMATYKLTSEVRYQDVLAALTQVSWTAIGLALLFTVLSFAALTFYDVNALDYVGRPLPLPAVAVTSFISYAIGNTAGFGALSGGAIRFRAYTRLGLTPGENARVIAFVTLSFGLGILVVGAVATLIVAPQLATIMGWDPFWLRALAVLALVTTGVVQFMARGGRGVTLWGVTLHLPDTRTSSRQLLVTALDIAAAASVLYVLLPDTDVSWPSFFIIYAAAMGMGVLSHVPAGLGVFETVMIAGMGKAISTDELLGGLFLYRLIYHALPLLVAVVLLMVTETRRFSATPLANEIAQAAGRLAPSLLSAFSMIIGVMLIFSSVTPTPDSTFDFLANRLPLPIVEAAHFLSSVLGLVLFVASRGLSQRLDGAWWVATIAASVALVLSLLKSVAIFQAVVMALFILAMLMNMRGFTRHASLVRQALGPNWLAAMGVLVVAAVTILLFVYRDTEYSRELWWQFEFSKEAPRSLRALLGLVIAAAVVAIWSLLRPAAYRPGPILPTDLARAAQVVAGQDCAEAGLVRVGDKHVMFSASGRAFIMYGIQGRSWIALLDPVGDEADFPELVWQFIETAAASGGRAAFYQVSPALLSHCADAGLRAFKLGEMALVDLAGFDLVGRKAGPFRTALNKGARDGLEFEMIEPSAVAGLTEDLRAVSDAWLADHNTREKRFSLGSFEPDYVAGQMVALLRHEGRIIAFATVMTTGTRAEATVDLMRFLPGAPSGAMDVLFIKIMLHLREAGYARFNLGMAPLSGMARREAAPVWDHIGGALFEHGERFYNFKGLRAFKAKFHPRWEPRYLAAANGAGAALALMDVTLLIGGGVRGVIGK